MALSYGALKKRGSFYHCKVYDDVKRVASWRTTKCTDSKSAKAWRKEQNGKTDTQRDIEANSQNFTFFDLVDAWLDHRSDDQNAATYAKVKGRAHTFWKPFFGDTPLAEIEPEDVSQYLKKRRRGRLRNQHGTVTNEKCSDNTYNDDLYALKRCFRFAVDHKKWLLESPSKHTKGIRKKDIKVQEKKWWLTAEEEAKLMACLSVGERRTVTARRRKKGADSTVRTKKTTFEQTVSTPPIYLRAMFVVALYSSLREGTLRDLQWKHITLKADGDGLCWWQIPKDIIKNNESYNEAMMIEAVQELEAYRERLRAECERRDVDPATCLGRNAYVFGTFDKDDRWNRTNKDAVVRAFRRVRERAGLEDVKLKHMRDVCANRLKDDGWNNVDIGRITGHKSEALEENYLKSGRGAVANKMKDRNRARTSKKKRDRGAS